MRRDRWKRARSILDRVLELAPAERQAIVAAECGDDRELALEIESLLALESRACLEPPSPAALASAALRAVPPVPSPRRIGPYELTLEIGAGGMGSVWHARRVEDFDQVVAIKLIKRGMDTDEVLRRFETERTVLATLQHDGIARLFDGGATENGVPYLVMEYVDGAPIDRFCAANDLSVRARIELVLSVCDAVQFAHEHLVVHRDLKPSNILVTRTGVPKLLDFGIAKVLSATGVDHASARTDTGRRVLTPAYASPEQLRGEPLTTQSDVFSLGLVLWELLVGRRAFERERSPDDAPARASAALATTSGSKRLARRLAGDLDTILARACHADRARRYGSIEAFSDDLRRHLADQPVRAQRDSVAYRFSKFARRNKLVVGSLASILVVFAAATAVSVRMVVRTNDARAREREQGELAQRRFEQTRKLATTFLFDVHDHIKNLSGATEARATLLSTALGTLDQLSSERSDQADLNLELFDAYSRLASIYSDASAGSLARLDDAGAALEKARAIAERFPVGSPERHRLLGIVEYELGELEFVRGALPEATARYERAAERLRDVPDGFHSYDSWEYLGSAYTRLAALARKAGDPAQARCWLDLAAAHHRSNPDSTTEENALYHVAVILQERGCVSEEEGDGDGAVDAKLAALALLEELLGRHPENVPCRNSVALVAASLSRTLLALERHEQALEHAERAVDIQRESCYHDPEDGTSARLLQNGLQVLGDIHLRLDALERAFAAFEEGATVAALRVDLGQDDWTPSWELAKALTMQAIAAVRLDRWSQSVELARRACDASAAVLARAGPSMSLAVASHRIEFCLQAIDALANASRSVDVAAARAVLALAAQMTETARVEIEVAASVSADAEPRRMLTDRCRATLETIADLSERFAASRD